MIFTTDCQFLENELMDVVRLFKRRPQELIHSFRFEEGIFYNTFTIDGQVFSLEDRGQVCDELEFKRFERRFAKLRLYEILSNRFQEKMSLTAHFFIRPSERISPWNRSRKTSNF